MEIALDLDFYYNFQKLMELNESTFLSTENSDAPNLSKYFKDAYKLDVKSSLTISDFLKLKNSENIKRNLIKFWIDFRLHKKDEIESFLKPISDGKSDDPFVKVLSLILSENTKGMKEIMSTYLKRHNTSETQYITSTEISVLLQLAYELNHYEIVKYFSKDHSKTIINWYRLRSRENQLFVLHIAEEGNAALLEACLKVENLNIGTVKRLEVANDQFEEQKYIIVTTIFKQCLIGFDNYLKTEVNWNYIFHKLFTFRG